MWEKMQFAAFMRILFWLSPTNKNQINSNTNICCNPFLKHNNSFQIKLIILYWLNLSQRIIHDTYIWAILTDIWDFARFVFKYPQKKCSWKGIVQRNILCGNEQGSPKDGYIHHRCFFRTFCFSLNLTGTLNLTKIVHYHW